MSIREMETFIGGFSIDAGYLKDAVERVIHVLPVKKKSGNRILDHVLFRQKGGNLEVQAIGLEAQASFSEKVYPIGGECVELRIAVPYKPILNFLKSFERWETVRCTQTRGENGEAFFWIEGNCRQQVFLGLDASECPQFLDVRCDDYRTLEVRLLEEAVSQTAFAADETSIYGLHGIYFEFVGDYTNVVATNRYILSLYSREFFFIWPPSQNFIVPAKALLAFLAGIKGLTWSELVSVCVFGHHIQLENSGFRLISPLIDSAFPDYRNALPSETPYVATLEREKLCKVIKLLLPSLDKKVPKIDLVFSNNNVTFLAQDKTQKTKRVEMMNCHYGGEVFEISFNGKLLLRILENLRSAHVVMRIASNNRAVVIEPVPQVSNGRVLCLIMPMPEDE